MARFCAKKCGMAGSDDFEQATADALVDQYVDTLESMFEVIFASDSTSRLPPQAPNRSEENKKAKGEALFKGKLPMFLKIMNNFLQKNGGKWLVGNKVMQDIAFSLRLISEKYVVFCFVCQMTWADLALFNLMDFAMDPEKYTDIPCNDMRNCISKDYPGICALCERVKCTPNIQKWLEERPKTPY